MTQAQDKMNSNSGKQSISEAYHSSLLAKVTLSMMKAALVLGTIMFIVGLVLYTHTLLGQYITESFSLARSAAHVADRIGDMDELTDMVMDVYRSIPEDVRKDQSSPEYREKFEALGMDNNEGYKRLSTVLQTLAESSDVSYLYVGLYDPKTNAVIYLCDPDPNPKTRCLIGEWEPIGQREMNQFTNWDGKSKLHDIGSSARHGMMCTSGYPVGTHTDDKYAFVLADITLAGVYRGVRNLLIEYAITVVVVLYLLGRRLNRRMTAILVEPIEKIGKAARQYMKDRTAGRTNTDHFDNLNINTGDEIENLAEIMADMEHNIGAHEQAIVQLAAEKERNHTELELGTRIQRNMLPRTFPAFPDRDEFDIYAVMDPAKEVGGDFYDFFLIDDDHLGIVMADVSGKGIPAALFMMSSMILINNSAKATDDYDPAKILETANNLICAHNSEDMFVTVWLGILDIRTGLLRAANGGHEYPAIRHAGGRFELLKDKHGFVLGTMEDMKYTSYELQLEPGAKVFLYTDGVPEATNAAEEFFGTDRLIETLNEDPDEPPKSILDDVSTAVDRFVKGAPQFDDLTMLCLEIK